MEPTTLRARVSASGAPEVTIPSLVGVPVRFVSGGTTLCTANVAADGTTAACEWTPATTGRYDIRAEIDGSDQLLGSNSATKTLNVTVAPPKAPTEVTADPANAQGKTQTVISGKAEPGTSIEVLHVAVAAVWQPPMPRGISPATSDSCPMCRALSP